MSATPPPHPDSRIDRLEARVAALEAEVVIRRAPVPTAGTPAVSSADGPVTGPDGVVRYYRGGVLHREDGPAVIWPDGRRAYWRDGTLQRVETPSSRRRAGAPADAGGRSPVWVVAKQGAPLTIEQLTSARVLAWAGGAVSLLGILFFFVFAARRGWFTPPMRVGLGAAASLGLLAFALRLHAREGRFEAALTAAGAGIAGLYATLYAATSLYGMIGSAPALALAAGIAGLAVAVALRIDAEALAGFGIGAALLAPAAVQGDVTRGGVVFVALMLPAAVALLAARGWWLQTVVAAAVSAPQLWSLAGTQARPSTHGDAGLLALAAAVAGTYLATAFLLELRRGKLRFADRITEELSIPVSLADVLATAFAGLAATVLSPAIVQGFDGELGGVSAEGIALLGAAAVYAALAAVPRMFGRRDSRLVDVLAVGALGYAAAGIGEVFAGSDRVVAWSAEAAVLALAARRLHVERAHLAAVAYLGLAAAVALGEQAVPADLAAHGAGSASTAGLVSIAAVTAAAAVVAACLHGRAGARREERLAPAVPLAFAAYGLAAAFGGETLVVAWAAGAAALTAVAERRRAPLAVALGGGYLLLAAGDALIVQAPLGDLLVDGGGRLEGLMSLSTSLAAATLLAWTARRYRFGGHAAWAPAVLGAWLTAELLAGQPLVAAWAAESALLALGRRRRPDLLPAALAPAGLLLAGVNALAIQATPADFLDASRHPADGLPALLALVAGACVLAWAEPAGRARTSAGWIAGGLGLYAVSLGVLGAAEALPPSTVTDDDVRTRFQGGHMAVSALWAVTGLWLLQRGLRHSARGLRVAGLALLALPLGKIFLYDLAFLSSITRAGSFLAVGVALLLGAVLVQRLTQQDELPNAH